MHVLRAYNTEEEKEKFGAKHRKIKALFLGIHVQTGGMGASANFFATSARKKLMDSPGHCTHSMDHELKEMDVLIDARARAEVAMGFAWPIPASSLLHALSFPTFHWRLRRSAPAKSLSVVLVVDGSCQKLRDALCWQLS